jgi:formamidopyrimidine-DNA glycosylase
MPELPEVETLARQLHPLLVGRRLLAIEIVDARLDLERPDRLRGRIVERVARVGKEVVLWLGRARSQWPIDDCRLTMVDSRQGTADSSGNPQSPIVNRQSSIRNVPAGTLGLCIHLRMTGRLIWRAAGSGDGACDRPPRARLTFQGGQLSFMDVRRFGTMRILQNDCGLEIGDWRLLKGHRMLNSNIPARTRRDGGTAILRQRGAPQSPIPNRQSPIVIPLDPLARAFTPRALGRLLARSRGAIKPWLMRQDRLAGIGNIYASEALHEARISPLRAAGTLNLIEVRDLHKALCAVLRRAIRNGGTTFSDFQDSRGEPGRHQRRLRVYERQGKPCRQCGRPIARIVQSGRSTFLCSSCQV